MLAPSTQPAPCDLPRLPRTRLSLYKILPRVVLSDTIINSMSSLRIISYGAAEDPIFGRERELARLERLVDGVSERGAALVVRGEAGIGESPLLAAASPRTGAAGTRAPRQP